MDIKSILMGKCRGTLSDLPSYLMGNGSGTGYTRTDIERIFTRSVSAGSAIIKPHGRAIVKTVRGNTVVWNQYAKNISAPSSRSGITLTDSESQFTMDGTATSPFTATSWFGFDDSFAPNIAGHKVLVDFQLLSGTTSNNNNVRFYPSYNAERENLRAHINQAKIINIPSTATHSMFSISNGTITNDVVARLQVFDLTKMFGAGSEPSTVAEFRAMFPNEYYAYSEPTLLSFNGNGIKSYDANGNVVGSCTIPTSTYFPDGMKSAGTVYDELLPNKAIKRIGAVDLGTLNWSYSSASAYFSASLPSMASHGTTTKGNLFASGYSVATFLSMYNHPEGDDLVMAQSNGSNHYLYIRNKAYTVAAEFKAAMSGVMLYYELAEPVETAIDPPLYLSYIVDNGGEEEVTSDELSSPMNATINYAVRYFGENLITQEVIDSIYTNAWISSTYAWTTANSSYSFAIPVTMGKYYRIEFDTADETVVGTIFRYGFTDNETPSSSNLLSTPRDRTTPQDAQSVDLLASGDYLIIQLSGSVIYDVVENHLTVREMINYTPSNDLLMMAPPREEEPMEEEGEQDETELY